MISNKAVRGVAASALIALSNGAVAQTPAPTTPPTPEHTFTANIGFFSEYIFRGVSQTAGEPAVQGGFDYAHQSGFYAGTWATNISWLQDFGAYRKSSMEWDFYGGYKANFGATDFFYDVGALYYHYPGRRVTGAFSADTLELYAAVGWKWINVKFSYNVKDYFGARPNANAAKTDGTYYVDLTANYPVGETGVTLVAHVGHLDVENDGSDGDLATFGKVGYTDWKLGVSYTVPDGPVKGLEVGAYYTGNNAKSRFYTDLNGYDTAKDRGVVYVKKTF
ncbi:MAG TPA: TorF family putative porin [Casimicrobiaceae bacterium]|nr:TorF family putative porin [Casimicrobiaceae bacterium]